MANTAKLELKESNFDFYTPKTMYAFEKDTTSSYFKVTDKTMNDPIQNTLELTDSTKLYSDTNLFSYLEEKFKIGGEFEINKDKVFTLNHAYAYWFYNNYEQEKEQIELSNGTKLYIYKRRQEKPIYISYNGSDNGIFYVTYYAYQTYPNKVIMNKSWRFKEDVDDYINFLIKYNKEENDTEFSWDNVEPIAYNKVFLPFLSYGHSKWTNQVDYDRFPPIFKTDENGNRLIPKSSYKGQIMSGWSSGQINYYVNPNNIIEEDISNMKNECYFNQPGLELLLKKDYDNSSLSSKIVIDNDLYSFLKVPYDDLDKKYFEITIFDNDVNLYIDIGKSNYYKVNFNHFYVNRSETKVNYSTEFIGASKMGEMKFSYDFSNVITNLQKKPNSLRINFYYKNMEIGFSDITLCNYLTNDLGEKRLIINHSDDVSNPIKQSINHIKFFSGALLNSTDTYYIDTADGSDEDNRYIKNLFGATNLKRADLYCNYLKSHDVGTLFNCQTTDDLIKNGIIATELQKFYGMNGPYYAGYIGTRGSYYEHKDAQYCYIYMTQNQNYQMQVDFYNSTLNNEGKISNSIYLFSSNLMPLNFKELPIIKIINNKDNTELLIDDDNIYNCVTIPKMKIKLSQKNSMSYGQYLLYKIENKEKKLIKVQDINFYEDLNNDINLFYYNELENEYEDREYILQVVAISVDGDEIKSPEYNIKILKNEIRPFLNLDKNNVEIKNENQISFKNLSANICDINIDKQEKKKTIPSKITSDSDDNKITIRYNDTFGSSSVGALCFEINRKDFLAFCDNDNTKNGEYIVFQYNNYNINKAYLSSYKLSFIINKSKKTVQFKFSKNLENNWTEINGIGTENYFETIKNNDQNCYFIIARKDTGSFSAGLSLNPYESDNFITNAYGSLKVQPVNSFIKIQELNDFNEYIFYANYTVGFAQYYYIKNYVHYYDCSYNFTTPINFE